MPLRRLMKGQSHEILSAEGLMYNDKDALTPSQKECINRLGMTIQMEQEAYLTNHPEVEAMLKIFISKLTKLTKRKSLLKEAGEHFTRPAEVLDAEIRQVLGLSPTDPYMMPGCDKYDFSDTYLEQDLQFIIAKHYPPESVSMKSFTFKTPDTVSSSFLSIKTSDTTIPTPEPVPPPLPTISEIFYNVVSNTVDKAIYLHVDDAALRYDTAYVELQRAVEEAMEIPVIVIKEDIAQLFADAYRDFELNILEKEREAAAIAWENRMRKKLKRTLRRLHNFKGYVTPPTPKSSISSHPSYKLPMPRPCECNPQWHYNRYEKDRFGIYLPREEKYSNKNVTVTPAISLESLHDENEAEGAADAKSTKSAKSAISGKSSVSRRRV